MSREGGPADSAGIIDLLLLFMLEEISVALKLSSSACARGRFFPLPKIGTACCGCRSKIFKSEDINISHPSDNLLIGSRWR